MATAGTHPDVDENYGTDVNSLKMVQCRVCETCAHAATVEDALTDLARTNCSPNCENCKSLRHSHDGNPAVPAGGSCNDVTHVCPNCDNRWRQFNGHFHLWKQVTNNAEWHAVNQPSHQVVHDFDW